MNAISTDGARDAMGTIAGSLVVTLVTRFIIPLIVTSLIPDLPSRVGMPFSNNLVRVLGNVFMICFVMYMYKYKLKENVWIWLNNPRREISLIGMMPPIVFLVRLLLDHRIIGIKTVFQPFTSEGFSAILTTPIAEELFYRGYLHRRLYSQVGGWPALVLSSAFFGLSHGDFVQAFLPGLLFGLLYNPPGEPGKFSLGTGRLLTSILMHLLLNIKTV